MNALPPSQIAWRKSRCKCCSSPCADFEANKVRIADPTYACEQGKWAVYGAAAPGEPALPSLAKQAVNFGRAVVAETIAVTKGTPVLPTEEAQRRLSICQQNTCGEYRESDGRCAACGCVIRSKTRWRSQGCPKGYW